MINIDRCFLGEEMNISPIFVERNDRDKKYLRLYKRARDEWLKCPTPENHKILLAAENAMDMATEAAFLESVFFVASTKACKI